MTRETHLSRRQSVCNTPTYNTHLLFNCTHICTTLSPLDLWTILLCSDCTDCQMDGEAGWWTTSRKIRLPPLARVMGVGRLNNNKAVVQTFLKCGRLRWYGHVMRNDWGIETIGIKESKTFISQHKHKK